MPPIDVYSVPDAYLPPFAIAAPAVQTAALVFSSPHSGRHYAAEFLAQSRLDPQALRKSEDCFVDDLFAGVTALGAPLISARFPRAYLDLNREPYELDPELIAGDVPQHANTQSVRVAGGLGTVARIVADGEEIYDSPIPLEEVLARIEQLYFPFHNALSGLIANTRNQFGYAILIDCHSMPSSGMAPGGGTRPDIVIGDRFGAAADGRLSKLAREALQKRGYDVQMNRPYAGGFITEHHGRPARGIHALQIEINRGLYVDERTFVRRPGYDTLAASLMAAAAEVLDGARALFERRAAAE